MQTKLFKKIAALVTCAAMATTLTAGVSAAVLGGNGTVESTDNSILILKELKVYNTTGEDIYLPTVDYGYTIAPATVASGVTVTDDQPVQSVVYSGVAAALTTTSATVSFSPATTAGYSAAGAATTITQPTAAATTGTSYYGGFNVSFDPAEFPHSGIYRYVITEADGTNTKASAGVVHQDDTSYVATRYLDVYVRDAVAADNATTDEVICAYVCWVPDATQDQDSNIDYGNDPANPTLNVTKTQGYVSDEGGDKYNTYNLTLDKTISGTTNDHDFPFQVVFSNGTDAGKFYYELSSAAGTNADVTLASGAATVGTLATGSAISLGNGDSVTFYGIPAGTTATVNEQNDTYDVYAVTMTDHNGTDVLAETDVAAGSASGACSAVLNATTTTTLGTADSTVSVTNELKEISPTGVIVRYAPYIIMIVAASVLFVVARKVKRTNEA